MLAWAQTTRSPMSAIHDACRAAREGDLVTLRKLLNADAALVSARPEGATLLHFAALHGQLAAIELLLEAGTDVNAVDDEYGAPAAGWANETGEDEALRLLARRGTRASPAQAAAWGLLDELKRQIAEDPAAIEHNVGYGPPLVEAALWGREEIVDFLVEAGADRSSRSADGFTPYELAVRQSTLDAPHTPIVSPARRRVIVEACGRIAKKLAGTPGLLPQS